MFDDNERLYEVDGIKLPSVTELLPRKEFYCTPEQLENARIDGTSNHKMIKMYFDSGDTFNDPYLIEFDKFWKDNREYFGDLIQYEKPMVSKSLLFGGTPDIVCSKAIIDVKRSRGDNKLQALQLAGYYLLCVDNGVYGGGESPIEWRIIFNDGKFRLKKDLFSHDASRTFMAILEKHYAEKDIEKYFQREVKNDNQL